MNRGLLRMMGLLIVFSMLVTSCQTAPEAKKAAEPAKPKETPKATEAPITRYELKLAMMISAPHAWIPMAEYFAKKVEERTQGNVKVKLYPGGQLGNDQATLEDMRYGTLDLNITTAGNTASFIPEMQLFSLSYLFRDGDHFRRVLAPNSTFVTQFTKVAEASRPDFKFLGLTGGGMRSMVTRFGPVTKPSDLKGKRMRVMISPIESKIWTALGSLPVGIPWTDLYTALQTGTVDAFEGTATGYLSEKLYEVAKYRPLTEHQFMVSAFTMSRKTWDKLPEPYQKAIWTTAQEANQIGIDDGFKLEDDTHKKLESLGVKINKVDKDAFQKIVMPLHDQMAKELKVSDLLNLIRDLSK